MRKTGILTSAITKSTSESASMFNEKNSTDFEFDYQVSIATDKSLDRPNSESPIALVHMSSSENTEFDFLQPGETQEYYKNVSVFPVGRHLPIEK